MAAAKPVIVVVHATSKQGTSVVNSLLQTEKFIVKCITRNANSGNAEQLAAKGAEVVQADAADAAQLRAAFEGAYGVFAVTTGLEIFELNKELEQGKMMADMAAAAAVKVFVLSVLEDVEKRSEGKYCVPPYQDKARIADHVEANHSGMIGVYLAVPGFYTNWVDMSKPRKEEDGVFTFATAAKEDTPIPWMNPYTAIGPVAAAAFLEPQKYRGAFIPVYAEMLTHNQIVETFTQVTGIQARYQQLTKADMEATLPPAWADILWQAYRYIDEFGYYAPERDMELVHTINPHPETWADFLTKTGFNGSQSMDDVRSMYM